MKKATKRTLALILSFMMILALLAACTPEEVPEETPEQPTVETPTPETPPQPEPDPGPQTLVVGYSFFSQKFSPFFSKTAYDKEVSDMTHVYLLGNDRAGNIVMNGIGGDTFNFNGTDYTYYGPADFSIVQNPNDTVDYNITLREDIVFSDGTPMTIDDVIFSLYVYSDPNYDGAATFYAVPVTGMRNYRSGVTSDIYEKYEEIATAIAAAGPDNTNFSGWTEEQQDAFWGEYLEKGGIAFAQEIVDYCVVNYGSYLADLNNSEVGLGMWAWGFADLDDDGIVLITMGGDEYNLESGQEPSIESFWNDILEEYGMVFEDINYETAGSNIEDLVISAFISGEGPKDPEAGGEITSIAGIRKTGPYSCTVTTDYFDAVTIYQFAFPIAPLHYYGDVNLYDYDNDMFGFPKGNLDIVRSKTTTPMGAGAYKFLSYESGVVSYEANESYFKGEPKVKYLRLQEVTDADKLAGIVAGSFDITEPSFSQTTVDSIKEYNTNGDLSGNTITTSTVDNLGYGYLGINAKNVSVGGNPDSQASKHLRSALATVLAVYRDTVNNSYYGERASTIQYPISNTSWAAPRPNDEGYRIAYSIDVNGNGIFTDGMTELQRHDAALQAAVGFLRSAGYTFDEASGQFTAAPDGAKMIYEIIIPADGVGDHPAYGVLTAAKEALATIGITLDINDPSDSNVLWRALEAGEAELWAAAWQATIDPDMYQVYHSSNIVGMNGTDSNHYSVADDLLDELIMEARRSDNQAFRKATYMQCLEIIMDWAVEIPNYQRQNAMIFSTERVNISTITPDITTFWFWYYEIELIEMN